MSFIPDPNGTRALANSADMGHFLLGVAEQGAEVARELAPVGDGEDPHPGQFRDSIYAELVSEAGQQVGRIASDDPEFVQIEFGTEHSPAHATLRRAAEAIGLDLRGE